MKDFADAGLNKYRVRKGPVASSDAMGNFGSFVIPIDAKTYACIIANDSLVEGDYRCDWEHVSVHIKRRNDKGKWVDRTPTWAEMCVVKSLFWDDEECVMQLHPPKSEYANIHPHTLHLWRPEHLEIPRPPNIYV